MSIDERRTSPDLRVVLADDHVAIRRGLAVLLATLPGITVVGEAGTGEEVLTVVAAQRPDVVVMDLRMPDLDGVEATRRVVAAFPGTAVLVLTMLDDDVLVADAMRAGARGYLLKTADQYEIERALHAVAAGQAIFSSSVAAQVLARVGSAPADPRFAALSPRERQILNVLATGATNAAIATTLHLSHSTVANNLTTIFQKLGVASRAEAIVLARDAGLGRDA